MMSTELAQTNPSANNAPRHTGSSAMPLQYPVVVVVAVVIVVVKVVVMTVVEVTDVIVGVRAIQSPASSEHPRKGSIMLEASL
jgi:hypothetical protein